MLMLFHYDLSVIAIIGGLLVSQMLTLYTTPVIYLYLDRLNERIGRRRSAPEPHGRPVGKPQTHAAE